MPAVVALAGRVPVQDGDRDQDRDDEHHREPEALDVEEDGGEGHENTLTTAARSRKPRLTAAGVSAA